MSKLPTKVGGVPLLHILFFIEGITMIFSMYAFTGVISSFFGSLIGDIATVMYLILGVLYFATGWGFLKEKYKAMKILAIIGLFAIPIATIFSIIILWFLSKSETKKASV
jgi:hypothetical protein